VANFSKRKRKWQTFAKKTHHSKQGNKIKFKLQFQNFLPKPNLQLPQKLPKIFFLIAVIGQDTSSDNKNHGCCH